MTGETKLMQDALTGGGTSAGVESKRLHQAAWSALRFAASRNAISADDERAILAALAAPPTPRGEEEWPDIGERPPVEGDDRTDERLRKAYCIQQGGVPDQTALVWRSDLMNLYHRHWTLEGRLSLPRGEIADEARAREVLDYAGDIRWRELAEGAEFTVIDRQMLGEMHFKARGSGVLAFAAATPAPVVGDGPDKALDGRCGFSAPMALGGTRSQEWKQACGHLAARYEYWKMPDRAAAIRAGEPGWLIEQACVEAIMVLATTPASVTPDAGETIARVKDLLRGDPGDEYTDHGMESAFFRWPVVERAISDALTAASHAEKGEVL